MQVPYLFMKLTKIVSTSNYHGRLNNQSNGDGSKNKNHKDTESDNIIDDLVDDEVLNVVNQYLGINNPSVELIKEAGLYFYKDKDSGAILGDFDLKSFELSLNRSNQKNSDFLKDLTYGDEQSSGIFLNLDI